MLAEKVLTGSVMLGLLLTAAPVEAQDELIHFTPSTAWSLDYGDHACTLRRGFASAEGDIVLQVQQFIPGHEVLVILASEQLALGEGDINLQVVPGATVRQMEAPLRSRVGDIRIVRFEDSLLPDPPDNVKARDEAARASFATQDAAVREIVVTGGFEKAVNLPVGTMAEVRRLMADCTDDLLRTWGFDPALPVVGTAPPARTGAMQYAARIAANYPRDMVRQSRSARVRVTVQVGPDGRVTHCHAHNAEPYPQFEVAACEGMMAHARYIPALDDAGNAVGGYDSMDIVYSLGS